MKKGLSFSWADGLHNCNSERHKAELAPLAATTTTDLSIGQKPLQAALYAPNADPFGEQPAPLLPRPPQNINLDSTDRQKANKLTASAGEELRTEVLRMGSVCIMYACNENHTSGAAAQPCT
jgi:hypothetical protein